MVITSKPKQTGCDSGLMHSEGQQSECSSKESGKYKVMYGKHIKLNNSRKDDHPLLLRSTTSSKRSLNRFNKCGNITRCYTCDSIRHWADKCPHKKHVVSPAPNHHKAKNKITLQERKKLSHLPDKLLNTTHLSFLSKKLSLNEEIANPTNNCKNYKDVKQIPSISGIECLTAMHFNEKVIIDIQMYQETPLLHLIDTYTHFTATVSLSSKEPKCLLDNIFKVWFDLFGAPQKFITRKNADFKHPDLEAEFKAFNIGTSPIAEIGEHGSIAAEILGPKNRDF